MDCRLPCSSVHGISILQYISISNYIIHLKFTYIGFVPSTEFALKLDITDENGYIIVNSNFETDKNGIYAVGDIIKKDIYQVSTAVADGVVAAVKVTEKCK